MMPNYDNSGKRNPKNDRIIQTSGKKTPEEYGQWIQDICPWDYLVTLTFQKSIEPHRAWEELDVWYYKVLRTTQHNVHGVIVLDLKQPSHPQFHALVSIIDCPGSRFLDDTWRSRDLTAIETIERGLSRHCNHKYHRGHARIREFDPDRNGAWYIANLVFSEHTEAAHYGDFYVPYYDNKRRAI